ncbi:MAG: FxsA family protein [Pseudomonadota bacterium]|nr:FxsA family protein [Pseudomonadota bacterium]
MNTFFLIFVGLPAIEIFLMIKIGGEIGAFNTIALIFLTAIIGVYFARIQGIQTLRSGLINIYQNKTPIYELLSGASIAFAAVLLIFPGFLTDFLGFILLMPFSRSLLFKFFLRNKKDTDKPKKNSEIIDGEIVKKNKDEL